jgi:hypothetical protein
MAMVFCRGCAKEIHESAVSCPHCGASQGLASDANAPRNVGTLIVVGIGWAFIMWVVFLFMGGFVIGMMNPENATTAGEQFGRAAAPTIFIFGLLSGILTKFGILPGTKKK